MKNMRPILAALCCLIVTTTALRAQVPQLINYQGRVAVSGTNFNGTGQFKFALVSGSGTTTYWSNDGTSTAGSQPTNAVPLAVTGGLYSTLLGDTTLANMTQAIPSSVFGNSDVRLRVWFNDGVNGWQQLSPDERIAAVGYAMVANGLPNGSITSAMIASDLTLGGNTSVTKLSLPDSTSASSGVLTLGGNSFLSDFGSSNTFVGTLAGNFTMTGSLNTALGNRALRFNTTGVDNTATGYEALYYNTSGHDNTANGMQALLNNTSGYFNTATGLEALFSNTTGNNNSAFGVEALFSNTTGASNNAFGYLALYSNTTGTSNTAFGVSALYSNVSGNYNTAVGDGALYPNFNGSRNVAVGQVALGSNTTGSFNTASGIGALASNTASNDNTAYGYKALYISTGANNIAVGSSAGYNLTTGSNNIDIGHAGVAGESNTIRIGTPGVQTAAYIAGTLSVPVLTITGGSDVAEPFHISAKAIPKGSVVVIDEEKTGGLKLSEHAYDQRVAGIVSGANGINPGIALHQEGALEGGQNVALSGRVYVLADAASGPIRPGDLLTTSDTPGHAMKVSDHTRAQGAVLGKAMSSLDEGRGMVLVLVTLQ